MRTLLVPNDALAHLLDPAGKLLQGGDYDTIATGRARRLRAAVYYLLYIYAPSERLLTSPLSELYP